MVFVLPMLVLLITAGCVSHPSASKLQPWPTRPPTGYAMLMIYWNQIFWLQNGYAGMSVYIDNVNAFKLHLNHYTWIYVREGKHTFRTKWGRKVFGWDPLASLDAEKVMTFADGQCYYLKLISNEHDYYVYSEINIALAPVSEQRAKNQASTCWFSKTLVSQIDGISNQPQSHISDIK